MPTITATTIARRGPRHQQPSRALVQDERHELDHAAAVVRELFPGHHKALGPFRYGVSRARNGSTDNPIYRLRQWIRLLHLTGAPRARAELIVTDLHGLIEELWGGNEDFEAAMLRQQEADAAEEVAETRARDPLALPEWIAAKRREIAAGLEAIAAAGRHLRELRRAA